MENIDVMLKGIVFTLGTICSWIVGGIGVAFSVLLLMMALDFITGLMVGFVNKELSSSIGSKGLIKKMYIVILISSVYLIEKVGLDFAGYTGDGLAIAFIIIELISIVENGGKLGVPIPEGVKNAIAALKGRG